jgi:hypothetical protein
MNEKLEIIRTIVRAIGFLVPLITLCIALFILDDVRDTLVGAVMGAASTAAIFIYKKSEDNN